MTILILSLSLPLPLSTCSSVPFVYAFSVSLFFPILIAGGLVGIPVGSRWNPHRSTTSFRKLKLKSENQTQIDELKLKSNSEIAEAGLQVSHPRLSLSHARFLPLGLPLSLCSSLSLTGSRVYQQRKLKRNKRKQDIERWSVVRVREMRKKMKR